jgi:protein-disulfide isomerase
VKKTILLAAVWSLSAQTPAKNPSALDKTSLEAYVRHLFVWGPQIRVEIKDPVPSAIPDMMEVRLRASAGAASQNEVFYVSKDGRRFVRGTVFNVAENPFKAELDKLKTGNQPNIGTPGAPVVIVLFSDFQCSFCKEEAKMLRANLVSSYPKEVRLYFKDYPLEQIHPWAKAAAMAGRCVYKLDPAAFWDYHDWIFEHQAEITPENLTKQVLEFAKTKPIDALQLSRCIETKAAEAEINQSIAEARDLNIASTPTLFVNGRRLEGQRSWPDLRRVIDYEIEYQKTAKNAGEDCGCEVKLPSLVK